MKCYCRETEAIVFIECDKPLCVYLTSPAKWPSTPCTGICFTITVLQYYICLGIVLTVILVLGLGLGFGIIIYFVGT